MVLVAHPDDESVGCGVLLQRMRHGILVFLTDGGPSDPYFWRKYGSREAYVRLRDREARDALGIVGVKDVIYLATPDGTRIQDQEAFHSLPTAFDSLNRLVAQYKPDALLTLAYEGGHPDHDSCSVLSYALRREIKLPVWEVPLYHRATDGAGVHQEFLPREGEDDAIVASIEATPEELERKRRMIDAYVSQPGIVSAFKLDVERYRPQVNYDYSQPPHPGKLNYEVWQWRMSGQEVSRAFTEFLNGRRR
jgi:N-acetylglucosamine malate deacetylase 2